MSEKKMNLKTAEPLPVRMQSLPVDERGNVVLIPQKGSLVMNYPTEYLSIKQEPVRSVLTVTSEFRIYSVSPLPNAWRRFWYWALLGWKWKKAEL